MLTMHRNGHQVTLQDTDYLMSSARTGPNAPELNSVGIECELNNTGFCKREVMKYFVATST